MKWLLGMEWLGEAICLAIVCIGYSILLGLVWISPPAEDY